MRLVIPPEATEGIAGMEVRVQAMRPSPARLESREKEFPAGSRLLLGYGLAAGAVA